MSENNDNIKNDANDNVNGNSDSSKEEVLCGFNDNDNEDHGDDLNNDQGSRTSSETINAAEQADDEEISWVISHREFTTSNLVEYNNKKGVRHRGKLRTPKHQHHNEDYYKYERDGFEEEGFSSVTNLKPPKVSRIFDDDSRLSAQSFENLAQVANDYWNDSMDVPLSLANEQFVEYSKVKKPVSEKDNMRSSVPTKRQDLSYTGPSNDLYENGNPDPTYDQASSSITADQPSPFITADQPSPFITADQPSSSITTSTSKQPSAPTTVSNANLNADFKIFQELLKQSNVTFHNCSFNFNGTK